MGFLSAILIEVLQLIDTLLNLYTYVILIAVLLSWVNPDPYNPIVRFLRQVTEPVFYQVRRLMPAALFRIGIDFTPMIVLFLIILIRRVLIHAAYTWSTSPGAM